MTMVLEFEMIPTLSKFGVYERRFDDWK